MTAVHNSWYVQIEGQVYGPYTHALMQDYVREGRIIANSQITANPDKGFVNASRYPQFKEWQPQTQTAETAAPEQAFMASGMSRPAPQPITRPGAPQTQQAQPAMIATQQMKPVANIHDTPQTQAQPAQQSRPHSAVFVIMAEICSGQTMGFLQALQSFGPVQRVGDTVWILRSAHSVQSLRNALSQTLTQQDRLFIVNSYANETAWFNIGQDMDTRIRALWAPQG